MFSTISPSSLFGPHRRLERPAREARIEPNARPKGPKESSIASNLNLALAGLNPNLNYSTVASVAASPPSPPLSFVSGFSNRSVSSKMPSTISSGSSILPHQFSRVENSRLHLSYKDSTSKSHSLTEHKPKSRPGFPFPFPLQPSLSSHPAKPLSETRPYTPRPSMDSVSASDSGRTRKGRKERQVPLVVPPPLRLSESNLHRKPSYSSVIEIVAPPVEVEQNGPPTPLSPEPPSEEEKRRRRLEKVMRTLGERVPAELIYRGTSKPIYNVNIFPDPPAPDDILKLHGDKEAERKAKLARRASLSLSTFTSLSSVTATLLPSGHSRGKSHDLLDSHSLPSPTSRRDHAQNVAESNTDVYVERKARPESLMFSPIVFAKPVARRLSFSTPTTLSSVTATLLPSDHSRGKPRHLPGSRSLPSPTSRRDRAPNVTKPNADVYLEAQVRPASMMFSPIVFAKPVAQHMPAIQPFRLIVNDEDELTEKVLTGDAENSDDEPPTPSSSGSWDESSAQSEAGHDDNRSNAHLHLHPRPDTPFADSAIPIPNDLLSLPGMGRGRENGVVRRERRQGWSGEWNRGDMQDVIQKLRSLK